MEPTIVLATLNAKYFHSNLALRYLRENAGKYLNQIKLMEFTINQHTEDILASIYAIHPAIIGFSCYIWNWRQIQILISDLKKVLPHVVIILGGPEVSYSAEQILADTHADIVMRGPGEFSFNLLIDAILQNTPLLLVPNISYRSENKVSHTYNCSAPLAQTVFPYTKEDMATLSDKLLYYESQRGCPFHCSYCLSSSNQQVEFLPLERIERELLFLSSYKPYRIKFIDRTFNCNKRHALHIWHFLMRHDNGTTNYHFEIAADLLDNDMLACLLSARPGLFQLEIGVQSTNQQTIDAIHRKMDLQKLFSVIQTLINAGNMHIHLDLIAGLPNEDYLSFGKSFNDVFSLRPQMLQLGFLKVLKGSPIEKEAKQYGIHYRSQAPYEVLFTNHLTYDDIIKLKRVEHVLETYYNGGLAVHTINFMLGERFFSPFQFFEELAGYWLNNSLFDKPPNKAALFEHLYHFCISRVDSSYEKTIQVFIKYDMLLADPVKSYPPFICTQAPENFARQKQQFYHNHAIIAQIAPDLTSLTPRQRQRQSVLEWFEVPVGPAKKPAALLFLYGKNQNHRKSQVIEVAMEEFS